MNRCHSCKNTRRQLLMLKCSHDTCIKCAADNYFINCKNRPGLKKPPTNHYYCEKCLEHTELDPNTIDTLRQYFMDNVALDQNHKNGRREKLAERQQEDRKRMQRVARLDHENTQRPKSLEIEIADRKRTLSKYLTQKQVDKFMQMQNEYGTGARRREDARPEQHEPLLTPQPHQQHQPHQPQANEYELSRGEKERRKDKERKSINDSFEQFAEQQRHIQQPQEYTREGAKGRNSQRAMPQQQQEVEYEIYHNGKGVAAPHLRADRLLQEGRTTSRPSSHSSSKPVGTIRSKRSPNKPDPPSPAPPAPVGVLITKQRVTSCRSEDNLEQLQAVRAKVVHTEYHPLHAENSQDAWEMESKSTRRQEKTLQMGEQRNSCDTVTVEKILDTFEASSQRSPEERLKDRRERGGESPRVRVSPQRERVEIYFCKIHEDEEIIYFCLKCNQLICSECALHGSHRAHEIHSLKKSAVLLRQRLAVSTGTLSKLLIEEESKEKILRECLHEIGIECARQKEQVRSSFENFLFHIDKKYKELLREVDDRFTPLVTEYSEKLNESRNNYLQVSKVKDSVCETLQSCAGTEDGTVSETSIGAACNQLGNFHVKRPRGRPQAAHSSIDSINRLTSSIRELEEFLKSSNALLFSSKKESLLSENSSLRLSESSNLLEEPKDNPHTPDTATPLAQSLFKRAPDRHGKKIVVSSYSLNVKSRVRVTQCDCIVESLREMQEIVQAIKPEWAELQLRALQ